MSKKTSNINTELLVRATAALAEEVEEDLKKPDPTLEKAKAILNENKDNSGRP